MAGRRLPPLNGLRAFEAAARRGSFVAAAEELGVTATERLVEPGQSGETDACIRFGRAGWSGHLACDFLFADRRIPVCSPHYRATHAVDAAAADPLAGHTLLEALSAPEDWPDWLLATSAPAAGTQRL